MKVRSPLCRSFLMTTLTLVCAPSLIAQPNVTMQPHNDMTRDITIAMDIAPGDAIYQEYLDVAVDHPDVTLSEEKLSSEAVDKYDPTFEENKPIFEKSFTIQVTATASKPTIDDSHLHVTYYRRHGKQPETATFPLVFGNAEANAEDDMGESTQEATQSATTKPKTASAPAKKGSWTSWVSTLLETTDDTWFRILLAFLLGFLLSLTPCVYPMIPITIGVLGAQASKSISRNFLLSLSYTVGLATTFATLGLLASFGGKMFGSLLGSPYFILVVVAILAYFAFSLLGFYEMYLPAFMQGGGSSSKGGSVLSAFLSGAASGTVASPCLSPGLILLLTIVSSLGNIMLGFALLFAFGIGLGLPLIAIGTFSGSIDMLPKAGMWMVEVKRLFGLVMLGMCFYFLSSIMAWHILLWIAAATVAFIGIFYLYQGNKKGCSWRAFKNCFGMALVAASVVLFAYAYRETYQYRREESGLWMTEYQEALTVARAKKKKILLDVASPYCSMCKAIDKKIFCDKRVIAELDLVVPLKIDGSDTSNGIHEELKKRFNVIGVPTFIIIDPEKEEMEVCRWTSDLYDLDPEEFINILRLQSCQPKQS